MITLSIWKTSFCQVLPFVLKHHQTLNLNDIKLFFSLCIVIFIWFNSIDIINFALWFKMYLAIVKPLGNHMEFVKSNFFGLVELWTK